MIEAKNLTIGYKDKGKFIEVYSNLNFKLHKGELTTLLGENGVGKSTLIKTLSGSLQVLSGQIWFAGKEISKYSRAELSSRMSVVLTERVADGGLTVYEMVAMGRYPYTGFFGILNSEDKAIIKKSMQDIGIYDMRKRNISCLSDGERQKVMIAKSIAQQSDVIILDEPTAFLDVRSKVELVVLLRELAKKQGKTFLMSSHDMNLAIQYSDSLWVMNSSSRGIECATTEEIMYKHGINPLVMGSQHFTYDYKVCSFRMKGNSEKKIQVLECDYRWFYDFLERNGFVQTSENPDVIVSFKEDKFLIKTDKEKMYSTISEFIQALKEIAKN